VRVRFVLVRREARNHPLRRPGRARTAGSGSGRQLLLIGAKDFWQHRTLFMRNTRRRRPIYATVDFVVGGAIAVEIAVGLDFG
jgi:hypothetical protein